ncbi:hypothetical protein, partial [Escherichia coli]|uniref:hypothetical protein n=1 Tax=Escherichia coli TaxID=562 RepID=UPI0019544766
MAVMLCCNTDYAVGNQQNGITAVENALAGRGATRVRLRRCEKRSEGGGGVCADDAADARRGIAEA